MVQFRIESHRFQLQVANVTIPGFCIYCKPDRNCKVAQTGRSRAENPPEEELPRAKIPSLSLSKEAETGPNDNRKYVNQALPYQLTGKLPSVLGGVRI